MDTKSRKFRETGNRFLFAVCVVSFLGMIAGAVYALLLNNNAGPLYDGNLWYLLTPDEFDTGRVRELWAAYGEQLYYIRIEMAVFLGMAVGLALLCLMSLIALLVRTTGPDATGAIQMKRTDRWWSEIQILLLGAAGAAGGVVFLRVFAAAAARTRWVGLYDPAVYDSYATVYPAMLLYAVAVVTGLCAAGMGLWLMLSLVRKIRAGQFVSRSLFGLLLYEPFRRLYHGSGVMRKIILIALCATLVSMTVVGAPLVFAFVLIVGPRYVGKFEAIKEGVRQVNEGNLTYQIPVDPQSSSELDSLGRGINLIFDSSSRAVQNEIRNQRMKTELISNVSHDLRTPLTSIITYLDLLKNEELKNERAVEYLDVLEKKADRLKQLTDDLFEAAKASSGTMPVEFTTVEWISLVRQTLGEFDRRIQDSHLTFLISSESEKHYVRADGQLLYRVMENLVGNALKYAMPGTRVYIKISSGGAAAPGIVTLEMKNVSGQPLNIDADELMERFKRGDEARATDGSGLGLAIAKDLLKLQNGELAIAIDGDLFKATASLDAAEPPQPDPAEEPPAEKDTVQTDPAADQDK